MGNPIKDAQTKMGLPYQEGVFLKAAQWAGFRDKAQDRARELNAVWTRTEVLKNLPKWVQDFIASVNEKGVDPSRT